MVRLVQRRPNQVVHPGVRNHKGLRAVLLHIQHPRQQSSRLRHQESPRLQQQMRRLLPQRSLQRARILRDLLLRPSNYACRVLDPQAAACIHVPDVVSVPPQLSDQPHHPFKRRRKRLDRPNLRSDMHAYPGRIEPRRTRGSLDRSPAPA